MAQDIGEDLAVDDRYDSASISGSFLSDTTSLSSTIFDYEYANGRRYHSYRSGQYLLPNDELEQDRLDMVHHAWRLFWNGKLTQVPLKNPKRVLDVGTGTGIWAIDFGDENRDCEVIGVDLSPIQPRWVPPNVRFEVDNLEDDWAYPTNHFDFIHYRTMAGSLRNWERIIQQTFDHLKPGGYVEITDFDLSMLGCDDGSLKPDSKTVEYYSTLWGAYKKLGIATPIEAYEPMLKKAGFVVESAHKSKFPLGPWAKTKHQKECGHWALEIVKTGIESYALKMFTNVLGWDKVKADALIEGATKEAQNPKLHTYFKTVNFIARKPE